MVSLRSIVNGGSENKKIKDLGSLLLNFKIFKDLSSSKPSSNRKIFIVIWYICLMQERKTFRNSSSNPSINYSLTSDLPILSSGAQQCDLRLREEPYDEDIIKILYGTTESDVKCPECEEMFEIEYIISDSYGNGDVYVCMNCGCNFVAREERRKGMDFSDKSYFYLWFDTFSEAREEASELIDKFDDLLIGKRCKEKFKICLDKMSKALVVLEKKISSDLARNMKDEVQRLSVIFNTTRDIQVMKETLENLHLMEDRLWEEVKK
jgi:hypothetical protein